MTAAHGSGSYLTASGFATSTQVVDTKTILDNFATMISLDGSVYRYTANSLELTPTNESLISGSVTIPFSSLPEITPTNEISLFKGTEWNFNISGIGSNAEDFYFTMKSVNSREDSEADLQISANSGTIYINQTEYPTTSGSLLYSSGYIYVSVQPEVTDMINGGRKYNWDIKGINETTIRTYGIIEVKTPTTRKI